MNGRRGLGSRQSHADGSLALLLRLVAVGWWWFFRFRLFDWCRRGCRLPLRFGERQTKEEDTGAFPRCGDDIVVVWAPSLVVAVVLSVGWQQTVHTNTTTFLHMHLAKKLLCLLSFYFSLFVATTTTTTSRHIGWVHHVTTISLSRGETGHLLCLLYGRILSTKNLLTITRPFFYMYIDEGSFLRRETCPLSRN